MMDEENKEQIKIGQHFTNGAFLYRVNEVGDHWVRMMIVPLNMLGGKASELSVPIDFLLSGESKFKKC